MSVPVQSHGCEFAVWVKRKSQNTGPRLVLGAASQKGTQIISGASSSGGPRNPQRTQYKGFLSLSTPKETLRNSVVGPSEECQPKRQKLLWVHAPSPPGKLTEESLHAFVVYN